ncbi:MAG: DUF4080 domain-containing protein [Desulfobulbaceae bacterium]|nr:DUF4080 domain-containing protein [Desulfobulbaceae bacterium]
MQIKLVAFNGRYIHSCLALFYVREELRRHLPEAPVALHQFTINDPYYPTLLKISNGNPTLVMFSVYIWNGELVARLLADLALALPETLFVLGGPQAANLDLTALSPRVTRVLGPVEGLPAQFYADLRRGRPAPEYRGEPGYPFPSPYRAEDLAGELAHRQVYYESVRGCPFACSYCLSSVERGMVWKDLTQVEEELAMTLAHHPAIIKFVDRTFNARPERALAIWRFLAPKVGATVCHFEMAPDLFSPEMFAFLAELPPGIFQFELGIQSTHPATLARVNRRMDLELAGKNLRRLAGLGNIHLHADLILGLPGDSAATYQESLRQVFALGPHQIQMGLLKVLPGTAISGEPGLRHAQRPPYEILASDCLDHATLAELYWLGEVVEAFHNNRYFPSLFKWLRARGEDPAAFFTGLLELCRQRNFFNRAATQELLSELLAEFTAGREDGALIRELLTYDWLRCGHRHLPVALGATADLAVWREALAHALPLNLAPYYDYRRRADFFRKVLFLPMSAAALPVVGLAGAGQAGSVAFLPEKSPTLQGYQKTVFFPAPD